MNLRVPFTSMSEEKRLLQLPEGAWEHAPREYADLTERDLRKTWKVHRLLKAVPVEEDELLQCAKREVVMKARELLRNSNHREYSEVCARWWGGAERHIPIPVGWYIHSMRSEGFRLNQLFARERLLAAKLSKIYKTFLDSSKALQTEAEAALCRAKKVFPRGYIQKLAPATRLEFGDDGEVFAEVPVYTCSALQVQEDVRKRLVERFRRKAREEQDIQPNGVVFDIVDPSLHSYLLTPAEQEWFREGLLHKVERKSLPLDYQEGIELTRSEDSDYNRIPDWAENHEYETLLESVHEMDDLRGAFSWVPTVVQCQIEPDTGQTSARILGCIPGLPDRRFCSQLYSDLEHVVGAMVPLLSPLLSNQDLSSLQVVFKVQEYVIPPNATYSGKWHTEGFGERILAAGVYYLDVDQEASGGDLSFVNEHIPSDSEQARVSLQADYFPNGIFPRDRPVQSAWRFPVQSARRFPAQSARRSYLQSVWRFLAFPATTPPKTVETAVKPPPDTVETAVKTGTAVSFMNSVPHRFKSIANDTQTNQRRLFLNLFIVNPSEPLPWDSTTTPSRYQLQSFLAQKGIVSADLRQYILDFAGGYGTASQLHHAVLRDSAREAMTKARARFGYEHYGNNGNLLFRHGVPKHYASNLNSSSSSVSFRFQNDTELEGGSSDA